MRLIPRWLWKYLPIRLKIACILAYEARRPRAEKLAIIKAGDELAERILGSIHAREQAAIQRFVKSVNPDWEYRTN